MVSSKNISIFLKIKEGTNTPECPTQQKNTTTLFKYIKNKTKIRQDKDAVLPTSRLYNNLFFLLFKCYDPVGKTAIPSSKKGDG